MCERNLFNLSPSERLLETLRQRLQVAILKADQLANGEDEHMCRQCVQDIQELAQQLRSIEEELRKAPEHNGRPAA